MHYDDSAAADADARDNYIDGQYDALALLSPQSQDYYYLQGWHETKRKLANGELCQQFEQVQAEIEASKNWTYSEDWEEF
ncbi:MULTISPECIES: hypothetical protein [Cyanophyceae]|nr:MULTISPECIES: hypothetical protein [Cyanophyceae]